MTNRILIAVDGSDCANRAASFGFELAAVSGAAVDVVHVLEPDGGFDADATAERARALLAETDSMADPSTTTETHLESGRPAPTLATFASERDADLIVMGRRGRSGLEDRLLGSVTDRVLRRTDVPVVTVSEEHVPDDVSTVLLTTDGSPEAERAAPVAAGLAAECDATIHVLTVVDVQRQAGLFDAGGVSREYVERLEARGQDALDRILASIDADSEPRTAIERGVPYQAINDYADEHDVDLVVMGSEGQSSLAGQRLGSVASRVLQTVERPVLVVPVTD